MPSLRPRIVNNEDGTIRIIEDGNIRIIDDSATPAPTNQDTIEFENILLQQIRGSADNRVNVGSSPSVMRWVEDAASAFGLSNTRPSAEGEITPVVCVECGQMAGVGSVATREDGRVCFECIHITERRTVCGGCGYPVTTNLIGATGLCPRCRVIETSRLQDTNIITLPTMRKPNLRTKELQSSETGEIIKHRRKFGVELEFMYTRNDDLENFARNISGNFGIVHDGSVSSGKELVSPVMAGKAGEDAIKQIAEVAKACRIGVDSSCGFHLHLHAPEFVANPRHNKKVLDHSKPQADLVYEYIDRSGEKRLSKSLPEHVTDFKVIAKPMRQEIEINDGSGFYNLKALLLFYTAFDDVFRGMQPKSRRLSTYCKPIDKLFSWAEIEQARSYQDLEQLWYRERNREVIKRFKEGGKSHPTRYGGLNLHILFAKGKTIEMRYHSPTMNAEKILRWVHIHQTIFDKIVNQSISWDRVRQYTTEDTNVKNKALAMCKILSLDAETSTYIENRMKKFMDAGADSEIKKRA